MLIQTLIFLFWRICDIGSFLLVLGIKTSLEPFLWRQAQQLPMPLDLRLLPARRSTFLARSGRVPVPRNTIWNPLVSTVAPSTKNLDQKSDFVHRPLGDYGHLTAKAPDRKPTTNTIATWAVSDASGISDTMVNPVATVNPYAMRILRIGKPLLGVGMWGIKGSRAHKGRGGLPTCPGPSEPRPSPRPEPQPW